MARRNSQVHYRTTRSRYRTLPLPALAAVVVVAIVAVILMFMLVSGAFTATSANRGEPAGADGSAQASVELAVEAGMSDKAPEASQTSQTASQTSDAELTGRDADFAVDPNRKDWNFSTNGKKTVYLTIDDGPSEKTQQVLDILDKYNCKATFFVVGHNPDYYPMIAEAYRRGHTIGLHTFSHDYAEIYSSPTSYFADLERIGEVVKGQIGFVPCFIRFPGGSSNAVSADYCAGIMTQLVGDVQERGYQYYDWNLSVGDGSEHTTQEIIGYGTAGGDDENIMLLCHDSATKQTTVDALPAIIEHYQALGYTFEAIDRSSWVCHHGVSN